MKKKSAKSMSYPQAAAPSKIETSDPNDPDREPDEYEVKDAVNDMERADKHKANPKMMKAVHKHLKNKITSLQDLRDLAAQKSRGDMDDDNSQMNESPDKQ